MMLARIRWAGVVGWLAPAALLSLACGSTTSESSAGGGDANAGTSAGGIGGSSGAAEGGNATAGNLGHSEGGSATACPPEAPPLHTANNAVWQLPLQLRARGVPLVLGEELTRSDGRVYKVSLLKFFLAEPKLVRSDQNRVATQFLAADSKPLPYGLALVDAEADTTLYLGAPAGHYTGFELGVGVPAPCNGGDPTTRVFPLSADGDMYWSWGAQYLFERIEGSVSIEDVWQPFTNHFGFDPSYRVVTLQADLVVGSSNASTLVFDLDGFLTPPSGVVEQATHHVAAPEWALENLVSRTFALEPAGAAP